MQTNGNQAKLIGILAATGGAACFSIIDMLFKFLSTDFPLYEVVFIRTLVALTLLLAVLTPLAGGYHTLRTRHPRLHLLRSLLVLGANITFFSGLAVLPLADAVAISFATPLIVTLLSVVILGEKVGPWRWSAVGLGFLGVVIIMRPASTSFQWASLLPFLGACGYAGMHVLSRRIGKSDATVALSFYPLCGFLLISTLAGLTFGDGHLAQGTSDVTGFLLRAWRWPEGGEWPLLIAAGLAGSVGGFLISHAYKTAEAGLIAPFEYIALPLAALWGVLVFQDWPDPFVWGGGLLIIAAGLLSLWRETLRNAPPSRPRPRNT
ncbi:EamA family transporter [Epibacterium sp. SM1979]|uniref:EamA family transporter n=1 Tax=Tritonibacter litoralis TaxID=2662264 RepID=A0A843YC57_9RHOB|nr:DMT family transporter [Tritonibacter litoralis]MQQ08586.1 EamA family transporter [Tritonibacter litoralis]